MDALPHELGGLQPQSRGRVRGAGGLRLDSADGLLQLVVVEQGLGEPEDRVDALLAVQSRHGEGGAQVADGGGGRGEEGGAAQFEEHARVGVGQRRFLEGAFQAAAGGVGGSDGEVLAGGLAQLVHDFLVVVRIHLEQVAGGRRGAESGVGDQLGRYAVHRGAQRVGDGVVDGAGDQGVDELQVAAVRPARGGVGRGEDAGLAQQLGAAGGVGAVEGGEPGHHVDGDAAAEDGGGPGEPVGVDAELFQAGDESAAPGGAVEGAQFGGLRLDGLQFAVLDPGEEFDGFVGVAAGDGPDFAAERGVGVVAEGGAGQSGRRVGGEGVQRGEGPARGGGRVQVAGAVAADVAGAAGEDDQQGGLVEPFGERGEPAQGLLVGPVGVVDQQDQRPFPAGEPAHGGDQSVVHALRVGLAFAGVGDAEGGARDAVPVAEVLPGLLGQHGHQRGLQQLAYDVEGDGPQGLAAAGRPDRAAPGLGQAAGLGEQCGLADPGLAAGLQEQAGRGAVGAQGVHRAREGGDFLVPLPEGGCGGTRPPYLRHPAASPSRPNDVRTRA